VGLRLSGRTLWVGRKQVDGTPQSSRIGGILISFLHKTRQNNEDRQFSQLLNRELSKGFPNPNRSGCPDSEFLQRLSRHQVPISEIDPWIDHLGSCSECFTDFNRLRPASGARRRRFILYAAAACIVLASAGMLWRQLSSGRGGSTPIAGVVATKPAVGTGDRSGGQGAASTGADRTPFEVMLNLTQSATRGEKSTNDSQMIRVPARLLECRITLPLGSSDGLYYIRVQRAVQSELLKTAQGNATIKGGDVRLNVELDLSNMPAGGYLLSYRHARESWHRVPIVITTLTN
jgi:hypothetical protein